MREAVAGVGRAGTHGRRRGNRLGPCVWLITATVVVVGFGSAGAGSSQPPAEDAVYRYMDDHGRLVHAQSLEEIPPRMRPYARRVDYPSEDSSLVQMLTAKVGGGARPVIYRYVTPQGQARYTNLLSAVPPPQRAAAEIDLSRVTLNSEVGRDLDRALGREHERLAQSSTCQQLRAAAAKPLWRAVWDDYRPLVVIGAVFVLLFLISPAMLNRFGANWAKAFSMSISVLAALGLFSYATMRGAQAMSQLKAKAAPCEPERWDSLAQNDATVLDRVKLVQSMQNQQRALEQIAAEGR